MAPRTIVVRVAALFVGLGSACSPEDVFCPSEPFACSAGDCADAGQLESESCVTFEQAAALAQEGSHGIHTLTTRVVPEQLGFVTATAHDAKSTCREGTCYLLPGAEVALNAVPETQTLFLGWSDCSAQTDPQLVVTGQHRDRACVARFAPAFIVVDAASVGYPDAPIHVTTSSGCAADGSCVVRYGGDVTLLAPTRADLEFVGWSGCATSSAPELVLSHVTSVPATCVASYRPRA